MVKRPEEYHLELSLPFPPAFEKFMGEFLKISSSELGEDLRGSLEEATREAVYRFGPENGEGRCRISFSAGGEQIQVRIKDLRASAEESQPDGGFDSPLKKIFSRVEYLGRGEGHELVLTLDSRSGEAVDFSSPLPLAEHQVIAGAVLAG